MDVLSKSQVDRLGERLKKSAAITDDDLRLLDAYRRSFSVAYDSVIATVREKSGLEPTGRPAKSTEAIIAKLRRESARLSQIQDIAGCRVRVEDVIAQDALVQALCNSIKKTVVHDRRLKPSNGYRAVHVVASVEGKAIEIQVRTQLQHGWAELSERMADVYGIEIKYGRTSEASANDILSKLSQIIPAMELMELLVKSENPKSESGPIESESNNLIKATKLASYKGQLQQIINECLSSIEQIQRGSK